jgi:hemerythrin-like domain-containing protein
VTLDPMKFISGEHRTLRGLLESLDDAAARVLSSTPGGMTALREATRALDTSFRAHLAMEESVLAPLLRGRALDHMRREHRDQRSMLEAILNEVEHDPRDPMRLAHDARWLVVALARDMDVEDEILSRIARRAS